MPARPGPRPSISTRAILEAVAEHGRNWPAVFTDIEIRAVNEAVDRELFAGTLSDAGNLSELGRRELARLSAEPRPVSRPRQQALSFSIRRQGTSSRLPRPGIGDARGC